MLLNLILAVLLNLVYSSEKRWGCTYYCKALYTSSRSGFNCEQLYYTAILTEQETEYVLSEDDCVDICENEDSRVYQDAKSFCEESGKGCDEPDTDHIMVIKPIY